MSGDPEQHDKPEDLVAARDLGADELRIWEPDDADSPEPGQEVLRRGRWTCRAHLWHRWRTHRRPDATEFGVLYQECMDCGKQREMTTIRPV